jgi:hypothetical protein
MDEDVVIDPTGKRGIGPRGQRFGASMAESGFYGFRDGSEITVVHARHIIIV